MANQANVIVPIKLPILLKELHEVEWMSIGRHLGVPDHRIQTIQQQFFASSPQQRLYKVLEWWMDNTPENEVTWIRIAVALRETHYYKHSEVIVRRYCSRIELDGADELSSGAAEMTGKSVYVNQEIVRSLLQLKFQYSKLTAKLEQLIYSHLTRNPFSRNKHISKFIRILSTLLEKDILEHSFTHAYNELAKQNDMFELAAFRDFVFFYFEKHPSQSRTGMNHITIYELNMKQFIQSVTLGQFRDAVYDALPAAPAGYDHLTLVLNEDDWSPLTLLAMKKLLYKVFGVNQKVFLDFIARKGSIIVQYRFREDLREVIIDLAIKNQEILKENYVIKVMIGSILVYQKYECKYPSLSVQDALHPVQIDSNVPGSFSVKLSQESPLASQQRTAPMPPTQARGIPISLTKLQIPLIHVTDVSSSESRNNTPPMSPALSPTSIYAKDLVSQQIDLPDVSRPRSYTTPSNIRLLSASQRNSPSISPTSDLGGHNHQTDLCDDIDNDKDFLRPGRRISTNSSIDSGLNSTEPTNEYTREFLKERRKGRLKADDDYFELKESLLSMQSMFFNEMRMMMLAQRESIFELKEEIRSLKEKLQCSECDRGYVSRCSCKTRVV